MQTETVIWDVANPPPMTKTIKDIIDSNNKEFEEKFPIRDFLNGDESSEFDEDIVRFRKEILSHLHQSQLRLLEGERERIAETLKTLLPKGEFNLNIHRILEVIHPDSLHLPETNHKEI